MNPLNYLPLIPLLSVPLIAQNASTAATSSAQALDIKPIKSIDIKPESHPEAYAQFEKSLKKQSKENILDFIPAMEIVLKSCGDELAAHAWMEKAAKAGIPAAEQFIGNKILSDLRGGQENSDIAKKGYQLILRASEAGYIPAMINVAICQRMGAGTGKSEIQSQKTLISACKSGNFFARHKWLQFNNRLVSVRDLERKEVQSEIMRKNPLVIYHASRLASSKDERLKYLYSAAELKHGDAIADLSALCAKEDQVKSFSLLVNAAKQNNADAMAMLGSCLLDPSNKLKKGLGIDAKDELHYGQFLIRLAATANSHIASNHLGRYYYEGSHGFTQDKKRAFTHLTNAARMNNPFGILGKSLMILMGSGNEQDKKELFPMLRMLASRGHAPAVIYMAYGHYKGVGVAADGQKAIEALQEAAAFKMPSAYVFIAYIYSKGAVGIKVDEEQVKNYINLASFHMGDKAQELFDQLVKEGEWKLTF